MASKRRKLAATGNADRLRPHPPLMLRVLGEMELSRGAQRVELPQSKKTRALLAYLVLSQKPQRRERLCNLLWDVADDPRAALRWSLTKLRPLLDDADGIRLVSDGTSLRFEPGNMWIDLFAVRETLERERDTLTVEMLAALAAEFRGELLEGLDLPDFHEFQIWCASARADVRSIHALVLGLLVERLMDQPDAALPYMRTLAQIEPADPNVRSGLILILTRAGRRQEAREQAELARDLLQEIRQQPSPELQEACDNLGVSLGGPSRRIVAVPPPIPATPVITPTIDLVGRTSEMQDLAGALEATSQQRALRTVLLLGEPGIGKTRLLNEIMTMTATRQGTVLHGAAYEVEANRPYGPWLDALRRVPPVAIGDTIGVDLAPLLPELGTEAPAQQTRDRLFGAVVELIAARAHSAPPVLLAFDDVQWCDDASAELLHYVIRMNRHRPVLVALAARDGEIHDNESISRVLRGLRRDGGIEEIPLEPLTAEETSVLVQPLASAGDSDRVFAASAGNPLFTLELARSLPQWGQQMPATLRQLVRDRIERLPPDAVELLRWSALLGQRLNVHRLSELAPLDLDRLMSALEALERHGVLRPITDGRMSSAYRFTHDLVREVVHGELSEPRRRLMHLRITRTLQNLGDSDEHIADLAHHAALAGENEIAARACIGAGRRYLRVFASAEADAIARRGMRHAQALNTPEAVKLELELAEICYGARRPRDAKAAERDVERLAQAALAAGYMEHARLGFHLLSYLHWEDGDWSDAQRHMMHAVQISRAGDARERVVALAEAARCLTMLERDLGHAEALLLEASALSTRLGIEPTAIPDAMGLLRSHEGLWNDAAQHFTHARDLCRREQDHLGEYRALEHLIMLELQRDQFAIARALSGEILELGARLREGSEAPFAHALAMLCDYADSADASATAIDGALSALRVVDAKQRLVALLLIIAEIELQRGHGARARERAEEARQLAEHLHRPSDAVVARTLLARAAIALGDAATAERECATLSAETLRGVSCAARTAVDRLIAAAAGTTKERRP